MSTPCQKSPGTHYFHLVVGDLVSLDSEHNRGQQLILFGMKTAGVYLLELVIGDPIHLDIKYDRELSRYARHVLS